MTLSHAENSIVPVSELVPGGALEGLQGESSFSKLLTGGSDRSIQTAHSEPIDYDAWMEVLLSHFNDVAQKRPNWRGQRLRMMNRDMVKGDLLIILTSARRPITSILTR